LEAGGFADCADCREYLWIITDGRCVQCLATSVVVAVDVLVEPDPESDPEPTLERGRAAKALRKKVERKYAKGKLGTKPKRPRLTRLAQTVWDDLSAADRDRLVGDIGAIGIERPDPVQAVADFCVVTVAAARTAAKKKAHR
jgi:hypothetical protein